MKNLLILFCTFFVLSVFANGMNISFKELKTHETYGFELSAFNTMNYSEFVNDQFISAFFEHHFQGLFLCPPINKGLIQQLS